MRPDVLVRGVLKTGVLSALWLTGCSHLDTSPQAADRDAYSALDRTAASVPGMPERFRIDPADPDRLGAAPQPVSRQPGNLPDLTLPRALQVATKNNPDFLREREAVYLEALALAYEHYLWQPIWNAGADLTVRGRGGGELERDELRAQPSLGLNWALPSGADLSVDLQTVLRRYLAGDGDSAAWSVLDITLRQPLLRGLGRTVAQERLVQAERDLVYRMRSFLRYRDEFRVQVASEFLRLTELERQLRNEQLNLQTLSVAHDRAEMLHQAGRVATSQLNRARQDELAAEDRVVRARRRTESARDAFKILLGIPISSTLALAPEEGQPPGQTLVQAPKQSPLQLDAVARANRSDFATARDRIDDAWRELVIARDNLQADLDVVLSSSAGTEDPDHFVQFSRRESDVAATLELDLPLDKIQERNAYRSAFVQLDRALRAYRRDGDDLTRDVSEALRSMQEAAAGVAIQTSSLQLAEDRVASATMLLEAGRGNMTDLLDAQEDRIAAQNQLASRVADLRIAVFRLWRDLGTLRETPEGLSGTPALVPAANGEAP